MLTQSEIEEFSKRIALFTRRASFELSIGNESLLSSLSRWLEPNTTVHVAHTPKASLDEIVRVALKLQSLGFRAEPHIAVRRVPSRGALRGALLELQEGDIKQAFIIAGDVVNPSGPFRESLEVMEAIAMGGYGIERLGVAGHPEGHKAIGPTRLWDALLRKQEFGARTGIEVHIVSQFGVNPRAVCEWERHLSDHGIYLRVHAGIAGPTSLPRLIRFVMECGVPTSMHAVIQRMTASRQFAPLATSADEMLYGLISTGAGVEGSRIVQPHIFTFGGLLPAAQWLHALRSGNFELGRDESLHTRTQTHLMP